MTIPIRCWLLLPVMADGLDLAATAPAEAGFLGQAPVSPLQAGTLQVAPATGSMLGPITCSASFDGVGGWHPTAPARISWPPTTTTADTAPSGALTC